MTSSEDEAVLSGGNASGEVVRIGRTVRKPWLPTTDRTISYMRALRRSGIDVPEPRGRDDEGRLILEYVPGSIAQPDVPLDVATIRAVGELVRRIHDASTGLPVPGDWSVLIPAVRPDLLCHNDLAAWNLIVDGDRLVFIDWDGAGPSTRLWDLAYAATSFGHLFPGSDVGAGQARLAAFVDAYDADAGLRAQLPVAMTERAMAMYSLLQRSHQTGHEPWASMYLNGHGEHWLATAHFIADHQAEWSRAITPTETG